MDESEVQLVSQQAKPPRQVLVPVPLPAGVSSMASLAKMSLLKRTQAFRQCDRRHRLEWGTLLLILIYFSTGFKRIQSAPDELFRTAEPANNGAAEYHTAAKVNFCFP